MTGSWARRMRATADGVPITTRDGLAGKKLRGPGRQEAESTNAVRRTAQQRAPLTLQHTRTRTTVRPLPPTFDSSAAPALQHIRPAAPHYCCKPPLLKVRLSIRGALNPYVLPPPAPDNMPRCTALHHALTPSCPWPRLPGCRRIAASVCQVLDVQNPALSQCWHLCLRMACCFPKPNTGTGI